MPGCQCSLSRTLYRSHVNCAGVECVRRVPDAAKWEALCQAASLGAAGLYSLFGPLLCSLRVAWQDALGSAHVKPQHRVVAKSIFAHAIARLPVELQEEPVPPRGRHACKDETEYEVFQ